ncbi:MAG TPA: hypothetical protein VGM06_09205 [Polyangiaceae bacterium]
MLRKLAPVRSRVRTILVGLGTSALLAGFITAAVARAHIYGVGVLWTALLLVSYVGWGAVVNFLVARGTRTDWGLRAGWGMSLSVLLGGFLCIAHLVSRTVLLGQVALGLVAFVADWFVATGPPLSASRLRRRIVVALERPGLSLVLIGSYAIVVLLVMACFGDHYFQPSDDPPLYMVMPKRLVESGSMFDPFAARRIPILGGHVYLHAMFLAVGSPYYLHVVDGGICVAITAGLVVGCVKGPRFKAWHVLPLALAFLVLIGLRIVRVNTGSLYSGVAALVTLYRTVRVPLSRAFDRPIWPMETRRVALLGAGALVTFLLRSNLAAASLPFATLVILSDFLRGNRRPWQRTNLASLGRAFAIFFAVVIVGVLPWSIMLWRSCGTFFYPFGPNNLSPGLSFLSKGTHLDQLGSRFISNLFYGRPVGAPLLFFLAGLAPLAGRKRNDVVALTLAAVVCLATLARSGFSPEDTARYYFAAVSSAAIVTAASVGATGPMAILVGAAVATHMTMSIGEWPGVLTTRVQQTNAGFVEKKSDRADWDKQTAEYLDVQSHIPRGATAVSVTREAFRFDFHRNRIFVLDALGAMGPKPGWPVHRGPVVLAKYLRDNGVSYVIRVDFNEPGELYNRAHWHENAGSTGNTIAIWAIPHLDAEDALDGLSHVGKDVYAAHGMTVIDLTQQ